MGDAIKVLVVGSAFGSIVSLFEKVSAIDKKHGKFSVLLCTGDFFRGSTQLTDGPDEVALLLDGKITAPMTTYVTQGMHELPPRVIARVSETGGEICPNVIFLGKSGVMNINNKIKIGCLGGILDAERFTQTTEDASPFMNQATIKAFRAHPLLTTQQGDSLASAKAASSGTTTSPYIDVLVSNLWPPSITRLSNSVAGVLTGPDGKQLDPSLWSAPPLDSLVQQYKPRYHFAAAGGLPTPFFWEREPFVWDGDDNRVARFVNLGAFGETGVSGGGGAKKPRWFYAFSIAPVESIPSQARPPNATPSPFYTPAPKIAKRAVEADNSASTASFMWGSNPQGPDQNKRPRTDAPEGSQKPLPAGYKCKHCSEENTDHLVRDCKAVNTTKRPPETYSCRACGSSEHYFKDCPQAAPRHERLKEIGRQLIPTDPSSPAGVPPVPGGGHLLIVPISHYPTLLSAPPDLAISIISEVEQYKSALRSMFSKYGAVAVTFEVARLSGRGGHAHIQVVPVPMDKAGRVEDAFRARAEMEGIRWESDPEAALEGAKRGGGNYFRVDLPDGRRMISLIRGSFNLQFGRATLAEVLGLDERADWKACPEGDAQQRGDAAKFKKAFASFDPASEL
ncbi:hypothetical protein FRC10_011064 [Ceratobasidium sp. 414]|nr:hypothetical protein FRC10_011064 [Ceratobasidium sp. 414]